MGNIANNYITWQNDGLGTVAEDGMIFLAKRMLQNYERTKNPLDIVRFEWYAKAILRYGKQSIPEATNESSPFCIGERICEFHREFHRVVNV